MTILCIEAPSRGDAVCYGSFQLIRTMSALLQLY